MSNKLNTYMTNAFAIIFVTITFIKFFFLIKSEFVWNAFYRKHFYKHLNYRNVFYKIFLLFMYLKNKQKLLALKIETENNKNIFLLLSIFLIVYKVKTEYSLQSLFWRQIHFEKLFPFEHKIHSFVENIL